MQRGRTIVPHESPSHLAGSRGTEARGMLRVFDVTVRSKWNKMINPEGHEEAEGWICLQGNNISAVC